MDITNIKSGHIYKIFVKQNFVQPCSNILWNKLFENQSLHWQKVYVSKLVYTKEQRLVDFNFKVLHNCLATPKKAMNMENHGIRFMLYVLLNWNIRTYDDKMLLLYSILQYFKASVFSIRLWQSCV